MARFATVLTKIRNAAAVTAVLAGPALLTAAPHVGGGHHPGGGNIGRPAAQPQPQMMHPGQMQVPTQGHVFPQPQVGQVPHAGFAPNATGGLQQAGNHVVPSARGQGSPVAGGGGRTGVVPSSRGANGAGGTNNQVAASNRGQGGTKAANGSSTGSNGQQTNQTGTGQQAKQAGAGQQANQAGNGQQANQAGNAPQANQAGSGQQAMTPAGTPSGKGDLLSNLSNLLSSLGGGGGGGGSSGGGDSGGGGSPAPAYQPAVAEPQPVVQTTATVPPTIQPTAAETPVVRPTPERGMYIDGLIPGGAAHRANLRPGDVIGEVNGRPTRNWDEFEAAVKSATGPVQVIFFNAETKQWESLTATPIGGLLGTIVHEEEVPAGK
jgi:hypothetical protein